ncbi:MAG: hypothetical protein KDD67_04535 [Ignavibacteriae bacterium]|nr:hypothetical protein [Ignavibacteriota bacterium]MCB9214875.1 hypothetical protein [Ignavibacteria bacterium]
MRHPTSRGSVNQRQSGRPINFGKIKGKMKRKEVKNPPHGRQQGGGNSASDEVGEKRKANG